MTSPTIAKILVVGLAVGVVMVPVATLHAQAAAAPAQPAASPIKNDTGKRICRTITPTGSRLSQRVCRTQADWDKDSDETQRNMQDMRNNVREPASEPH